MVEPSHSRLSMIRQCRLLGFSHSGFYYREADESGLNRTLMRLIDE